MLYNVAPLLLLASSASAAVAGKKSGFVTTKGNVFKLDGKDFYFAGSNAYYFPFNDVSTWCITPTITLIIELTVYSFNPMLKLVLLPQKKLGCLS
jgi:hypothetical protein